MLDKTHVYHYSGEATIVELANEDIIISQDNVPTWTKSSSTGKFILEELRAPKTLDELTQSTCLHYSLPAEAVRPIIEKTINRFVQEGIVTESGTSLNPLERQSIEDFHLQQIWFNITDSCNLNCPHCFARKQDAYGFAPLKDSISLLEKACALGVDEVVFSGGEPTLHPDLIPILKYARGLGKWRLKLLTNGFLAGDKKGTDIIKEICQYVDDIQVSIDGVSKNTHDKIRGMIDSFQRACRTVRIVSDTGTHVGISFTPLPKNLSEIPKLYNLAIDLRANYIHLNRPKFPAVPGNYVDTREFVSEEFMKKIFLAYDELLIVCHKSYEDMRGMPVNLPVIDTSFDPASELIAPYKKVRCGAGILTIAVNYQGDAFPCAALTRSNLCFGNVFQDDLSKVHEVGRNKMVDLFSVDKNEECSNCVFRYYCGGGCRATARELTACDSTCSLMKDRYIDFWERLSLPIIRTGQGGKKDKDSKGVPLQSC